MTQYWWTSDLHFGHANMIKYLNRPYENVREMNEDYIRIINNYVGKGDVLILAGDITLNHHTKFVFENYINVLNGNKILIKGNHDYWLKRGKYIDHRKINGTFYATSHYPMRSWNRSIHGSINLHGHSHGALFPFRNQLDISIDNAYHLLGESRPFNEEDISAILEKRKQRPLWRKIAFRYVRKLEAYLGRE